MLGIEKRECGGSAGDKMIRCHKQITKILTFTPKLKGTINKAPATALVVLGLCSDYREASRATWGICCLWFIVFWNQELTELITMDTL